MLTIEDIKLLIKALDAWIEEPMITGSMVGLFDILLKPKGESRKEQIKNSFEKSEDEKEERAEIGTMLKAKLILMKQSILDLENKTKNTSIEPHQR